MLDRALQARKQGSSGYHSQTGRCTEPGQRVNPLGRNWPNGAMRLAVQVASHDEYGRVSSSTLKAPLLTTDLTRECPTWCQAESLNGARPELVCSGPKPPQGEKHESPRTRRVGEATNRWWQTVHVSHRVMCGTVERLDLGCVANGFEAACRARCLHKRLH